MIAGHGDFGGLFFGEDVDPNIELNCDIRDGELTQEISPACHKAI